MTRNSIYSATACAWLAMAISPSPLRAELKPEDLYSAVSPSVVTLHVENTAGRHFVGSAFLAMREGLAITAWHVVHDARRVEACYPDNQQVKAIGLVDKNEQLDLALIKLEGAARPRITLASATPRIGSRIYVLGAPRGLDFSISEGLVSQVRTLDGVRYYQLSCPVSPGDSGGPVLNDRGEAIGVVSWRKADAETVGFAVPCPAIAAMHSALPPIAWLAGATNALSRATLPDPLGPAVRGEMTPLVPPSTNEFLDLQHFLRGLAGERVSVIVQAHGEEKHFNIEVPQQAAK
jgi:S1-C subfamily serine protease